jgi:hypothetical protein
LQPPNRRPARLRPLLRDLDSALAEVDAFRSRPCDTLRIKANEPAARTLVRAAVPVRAFIDVLKEVA